jgi:hypothetical protein
MASSHSSDAWPLPAETSSPPAPAAQTDSVASSPGVTSQPGTTSAAAPPQSASTVVTQASITRAWERAATCGSAATNHAAYLSSAAATQRYAQFPEEIAALYRRLEHVKGKLVEMEKVVDRFESVKVPVVASDGFTYDKPLLQAYFAECRAKGVVVLSHQNQQELRDLTIPNNSLTKLLEQLRPLVNPVVEPPIIAAHTAAMRAAATPISS